VELVGVDLRVAHQVSQQARFERAVVGDRQRLSRGIGRMPQPDMATSLAHDAVAKVSKARMASRPETTGSPDVIG
jgi:hypothetical protein